MISIDFDSDAFESLHEFTIYIVHPNVYICIDGSYIDEILTLDNTKFTISELIDTIKNEKYLHMKYIVFTFECETVWVDITAGGIYTTFHLDADDFRKAFIDCLLKIQNITADSESA